MTIENLLIEKITVNGFGIGYHEGKTVFVFGGIKDDVVNADIYHSKKNLLFAQIKSFAKKSELRTETPECNHSNICGGCIWLDVNYNNQLKLKQANMESLFTKYGVRQIIPSDTATHYRNKSFFPISTSGTVGMYEKNSHNIINPENCILHPKIFHEIISEIEEYIKKSKVKIYNENEGTGSLKSVGFKINEQNEILVILVSQSKKLPFIKTLVSNLTKKFPQVKGIVLNINRTKKILGNENIALDGQDFLFYKIEDKIFKVDANSFFQINSLQAENLYEYVEKNVDENSSAIDAYSGVGTIGIYLTDKLKSVYCIEENPFSIKNLQENIRINSCENVKFHHNKVEDFLGNLPNIENSDCIIFDPPRVGLEKSIIEKCKAIPKIIYVSCNPMTLLRDIKLFENIGFAVKEIQPFDMFPYTHHIETVAVLTK